MIEAVAEPWEAEPARVDRRSIRDAPVLWVDGFGGPLDWLLELARAQQVDLTRLSILALIDAFMSALDQALSRGRADLSQWGEWLVMAAMLTALRSRLLLPRDSPASRAAHAEAEAIRRRLLDRAAIERAAAWLGRRPQLGRDVFARGGDEALPAADRHADIADLFRACLLVLRVPEDQEPYRPSRPPLWRVTDATARIRAVLAERPSGVPIGAFLPALDADRPDHDLRCRVVLASTLLAGLGLARDGEAAIEQRSAWANVEFRNSG